MLGYYYADSLYLWNDMPHGLGGLPLDYPSSLDTDVLRFKYDREYQ